ncbi:hypothetical protein EDC01DRAFT_780057 [Geopyxis carbonaria]|nr:hypothetical protein EDC01DRAFT_780057 [Geopyxis carbonaria]
MSTLWSYFTASQSAAPSLPPEVHTIATAAVRRYHDVLLALARHKLGHRIELTPWPDTRTWSAENFLEIAENYSRLCEEMEPLQPDVNWKFRHEFEATGLRKLVLHGQWAYEAVMLKNWLIVCGYFPLGDRVPEELWR